MSKSPSGSTVSQSTTGEPEVKKGAITLYAFVGVWDGIIDIVSGHLTRPEAEKAFKDYMEMDEEQYSDLAGAGAGLHQDGAINEIELTLEECARLFAKVLNDPSTEKVQEFGRLLEKVKA